MRHQLSTDNNRSKTLYKITTTLTTDTKENIFPSSPSNKKLPESFANFSMEKINKIR